MQLQTAVFIMAGLFTVGGLLSICAALFNFDWFFRSEGVRMLTGQLHRRWQRAVYAVVGLATLAMAAYIVCADIQ